MSIKTGTLLFNLFSFKSSVLTLAFVVSLSSAHAQRLMDDFSPMIKGLPIVRNMAEGEDGKVYVAGNFSLVGDQRMGSIARLNADGTPDETFNYNGPKLGGAYVSDIVVSNDSILFVVVTDGLLVLKKDGTLDPDFKKDERISSIFGATFLNEKYLVTARMSDYPASYSLLLLNRDGSIDETYEPVEMDVSNIWARFHFTSDGDILIIGGITQFNGEEVGNVIRLNSDLSVDETFSPAHVSPEYYQIRDLTIQPDDKIILTGNFTSYADIDTPGGIIRLNSDGTVDNEFILGPLGNIINRGAHYASVLSDGKIVVAGLNYSDYLKYVIVKLNTDGSIDSQLPPNLIRHYDLDDLRMFVNADVEIFVAGDFIYYDSETLAGFAAFDVSGNRLPINPKIGRVPFIKNTAIQSDGKILIVGDFYEINGLEASQIARLNPDGTLDNTFTPDMALWNRQKARVSSVALQSDRKIVVGGYFTRLGLANYSSNLIRLGEDGVLDLTFDPIVSPRFVDQGVTEILIEPNDDIVIGGSFGFVGSTEVLHFAKIDAAGAVVNNFNGDNIVPLYSWVNSIVKSSEGDYIVAGTGYNPSVGFIYTFDETGSYTGSFGDFIDLTYLDIKDASITDSKLVFGGTYRGGGSANQAIPLYIVNLDGSDLDDLSINATDENDFASYSSLIEVGKGELIIGGYFEKINGYRQSGLNRVKLNGFIDQQFDFNVDGSVSFLMKEDEETLLVFGQFDKINEKDYLGGARLKFNNDIPIILSSISSFSTPEDMPMVVQLSDFDIVDADDIFPADFSLLIENGENYTVSGNLITPSTNFFGSLAVIVKVSDGKDESEPYELSIEVTPVNDKPVISGFVNIPGVAEGETFSLSLDNFTVTDPDNTFPDDFTLTLEPGTNYTLDGLTVIPNADFNGKLIVKARVNDGELSSDVFEAEITVVSTNEAPVISAFGGTLSTPEETVLVIELSDFSVQDPDNTFPEDFTLSIESGDNYTVAGATITPATAFNGTLTVPLKVNDGEADSPIFELSVEVTPVNDVPVILSYEGILTGNEDTPLAFSLGGFSVSDPDNTFPTDFSFTLEAGDNYTVDGVSILPAANYFGSLSVLATVSDGAASSAPYVIAVTINPVNDNAVITGYSGSTTTPEETALTIDMASLAVTDPDNSFPADFTLEIFESTTYTISGAQIIPINDFNGTMTVPVRVSTIENNSEHFNLTIEVTPVNDVPVIEGYSGELEMDENTSLEFNINSFLVSDPDNTFPDEHSVLVSEGDNYSVNGTSITPTTNFTGELSVPVSVSDGTAASTPKILTITVNEVTGISSLASSVAVFPIPTENELTLKMDNGFVGDFNIRLVDLSGKVVLDRTIRKNARSFESVIDLRHIGDGTFVFHVELPGHEVISRRIIIE